MCLNLLSLHLNYVVLSMKRTGEAILRPCTLLSTVLSLRPFAKPFLRTTALLAAVLIIATSSAPLVRGATPSDPSSNASPSSDAKVGTLDSTTVAIPGPLRSFLRMAGISQKVTPDEVVPLLARNVFVLGYEGEWSKGRPSEFLVLLNRYVQQARELVTLAGPSAVIHVSTCDDAKPLLKILGYRTRADCGKHDTYLETADPQRAFLTIDSGFPLPDLEKSLQEGQPFSYSFKMSRVPSPPVEIDWARKGKKTDVVDMLLSDPGVARFYWALARMDAETLSSLRQSNALKKMVPL